MNKEKQIEEKAIEEMAKVIEKTEQIARDAHCGLPSPKMYAKDLYWHGYHKRSEWISVDERLPNESGYFLVYIPRESAGFRVNAYYYCENETWEDGNGMASSEYYGITNWMPLPEPPKMKGGEADA